MILIRHAEKKENNNTNTDSDLKEDQYKKIQDKVKYLIKYYKNPPNYIISSPFLRTRKTSEAIQNYFLIKLKIYIPIIYDNQIGEYLGNQKNKEIKLEEETLKYNPIGVETWREFINRVSKIKFEKNNWYITHGIVIKNILYINNINIPYPKYLDHYHILLK